VQSDWKVSENKQRAKYYRLTAAGRKQLVLEQSRWSQIVEAVASLAALRQEEA
jgi:DNA-binding PadR family transcriptional regulator